MQFLASRGSIFRFGPFEFEVRSGVLRRSGKPLPLQPQPAKVLALLVSRRGDVVTREELRHEVWGGTTFVDFEHNLNFSVRQVRAALRDSARKPRFIETLPRRGYRFMAAVTEASTQAISSLAVLPLENLSNDPEQEYFADGMTDELITELAKIGTLRVISRTSVQSYRRARKPLAQIARRLNVDAVVEGTVLRSGNRIRITAQLIDAREETHLWAEVYERDIGDVLQLQAELAQAIPRQVHIQLTNDEQSRFKPARRVDPASYERYLRGRYFWNQRTEKSLQRAQDYFSEAISRDSHYALAYAGLADTYFYRGYIFGNMDPKDAMPKAKEAALKALECDPGLGEAHVSLAIVQFLFDWDWPGARQEFRTALRLSPNYPTGHHAFAAFLACTGQPEKGLEESKQALAIDPLSVPINNIVGEMYMFNGKWADAIDQFRKTVELDPNAWIPHENLGIAFEETGNSGEAVEEYLLARTARGAPNQLVAELRSTYVLVGLQGFWQRQLEIELRKWTGSHSDTFRIASLYARLGVADEAIAWLDKALEMRSGWMVWIKSYPCFQGVCGHPAFREIARRVGLPV
jgi:TolB-like protein/Tfp pilus assembly protein PilF